MARLTKDPALPRVSGLAWEGVSYFCSVRQGGVSTGACSTLNLALHTQDDPALVNENRRRLTQELPGQPHWLNQIHGTQVFDADHSHGAAAFATPTADAAITSQPNQVLAIMTADCLPVVIADSRGRALGVAHAGWRGLLNGVLEATLRDLRAKLPEAQHWRAWIGPAISQRHFEVGDDVFSAFVGQDAQADIFFAEKISGRKWLADLPGLARYRLYKAGVAQVELSGYCTFGQPELFYSYRREPAAGRIATIAWLTDPQDL
ncbi:MAG TPA: peptidoglycan editing factor PgeF [Eoetvoesiella sp.]